MFFCWDRGPKRMSYEWPVILKHGDVTLRPLRWGDRKAWARLQETNREWLKPWEATHPDGAQSSYRFLDVLRAHKNDINAQRSLPLVIEHDGLLVGQITLGNILWGSLRQAYIGYWISKMMAGRGITPTAVAMMLDHAILTMNLHRVEINIRPENAASMRVVEKLGLYREGERPRYLHIAGDWRDHVVYVMRQDLMPTHGLTLLQQQRH